MVEGQPQAKEEVKLMHVFKHPKYYEEMRKRAKKFQEEERKKNEKQQAASDKQQAEKDQASSDKPREPESTSS